MGGRGEGGLTTSRSPRRGGTPAGPGGHVRAFSDGPPLHEHRWSQRSHSHGVEGTWAIARTASSSGNSSPEISTTQSSPPSSITPEGRTPSDLREQRVRKGISPHAALLRRVGVQHWGQCQQ